MSLPPPKQEGAFSALLQHLKVFAWGAKPDNSSMARHDALDSILDEAPEQQTAASQPDQDGDADPDQQQRLYGELVALAGCSCPAHV